MSGDTYRCEQCGGTFNEGRSKAEAEAEAEALWGVESASTNPGMARVCDECFKEIMADVE